MMMNLIALWVLLIVALVLSGYRYETSKRRDRARREAADRWHQAMRDAHERIVNSYVVEHAREPRCDCQNPEPASGAALVSMECPVHNEKPRERPTDDQLIELDTGPIWGDGQRTTATIHMIGTKRAKFHA